MHRRWRGSLRQARARRVVDALQWECKALQSVAAIGQAYHAHLMTLGRRPREAILRVSEPLLHLNRDSRVSTFACL